MIYLKLILIVSLILSLSLLGVGIKAWIKKKEIILSSCGSLDQGNCEICKDNHKCKKQI